MRIGRTCTHYLPHFGQTKPERVGVMAVLAYDNCGQCAVYVGTVPEGLCNDMPKYDRVAYQIAIGGAKQTFRDAGYYFRGLDESKYRL